MGLNHQNSQDTVGKPYSSKSQIVLMDEARTSNVRLFLHGNMMYVHLGGGFKYVLFSPLTSGKIPNLTKIFQRGWNHQLDMNHFSHSERILAVFVFHGWNVLCILHTPVYSILIMAFAWSFLDVLRPSETRSKEVQASAEHIDTKNCHFWRELPFSKPSIIRSRFISQIDPVKILQWQNKTIQKQHIPHILGGIFAFIYRLLIPCHVWLNAKTGILLPGSLTVRPWKLAILFIGSRIHLPFPSWLSGPNCFPLRGCSA